MRITKRRLKKIIREEYTRLKRQGLLNEVSGKGYMINDAMGGPEDQAFPAGTTVQQAADQMVRDMQMDYPGALEELQSMNLSVRDLDMMAMDGMTDVGEAVAEAIEYMDIEGSGNFDGQACITALHQAIYGRRAMAESRRGQRRLRESYMPDEIDACIAKGMSKQQIFQHIRKQEKEAGRRPNFREIYDTIDAVMQGIM